MLSFTALSETAVGESTTVLDANAFMIGASAVTSAGTIGQSGQTKASSATVAVASGTLGVAAQTTLSSTTTTISLHHFTAFNDVRGSFSAYPDGAATATTSVDTVTANGKANVTSPAAIVTPTAGTLGFNAKAVITLNAATADADLTVNAFEDEDAQASATVSGVSATTSANWDTQNGIYAVEVVFTSTDFERKRCVNIVPYGNYKIYVTR